MAARQIVAFLFTVAATAALLPSLAAASVSLDQPNLNAQSNGLVGYWTFDGGTLNWKTGSVKDLSGQANTGQLVNMSTTTSPVAGKFGGALFFPGVGGMQYLSATTPGTFTTFSISFWQYEKPSGNDSTNVDVLGFGGTDFYAVSFSAYRIVNGPFQCRSPNSNGTAGSASGSDYLTRWRLLTYTFHGTTMNVYRDGMFQVTCDTTGSGNIVTNPQLQIGNRYSGRDLVGTLDDVRIYNRALSAQEVALLYAAGQAHVDQSNSVSLSSGLVGHWTFDGGTLNWKTGKVQDTSGNSNTGTLVNLGTTTAPTQGPIGQALKFNGTNSYIAVPTLPITSGGTATISAWINFPSFTGNLREGIFSTRSTPGINVDLTSTESACTPAGVVEVFEAGATLVCGHKVLTKNTWYHVLVTLNGTSVTIYINGVLDNTGALTWNWGTNNQIGMVQGVNYPFPGTIDDVRIYNRALSAQEVQQLYALGAANIAHSNTVTLSTGLVGYWSFDGGSLNWKTGTVKDLSGQSNNGSLIKMSTTSSPVIGKLGQALKFNGSTQYIHVSYASSIVPSGDMTVSAWVKTNVVDSAYHFIVSQGGSNCNDPDFQLRLQSNNIWSFLYSNSTGASSNAYYSTVPTAGVWYHLVGVRSNNIAYLYVNGILGHPGSSVSGTFTNTKGLEIGIQNCNGIIDGTAVLFFNGTIDDVRIYNRALSAQEVQQLYLMGK